MAKSKKDIAKKAVKDAIDDDDKDKEEEDGEGGPFKKYKNLGKK